MRLLPLLILEYCPKTVDNTVGALVGVSDGGKVSSVDDSVGINDGGTVGEVDGTSVDDSVGVKVGVVEGVSDGFSVTVVGC
jgi:hypothetical protein